MVSFIFFSFHFGDDANDFWVFMPHANIDEATLSVLNGNQADCYLNQQLLCAGIA
jgi:hypothetical protein